MVLWVGSYCPLLTVTEVKLWGWGDNELYGHLPGDRSSLSIRSLSIVEEVLSH